MPSGTVTSKGTRPSTSRTITAESANASGLASKTRCEIARGRGLRNPSGVTCWPMKNMPRRHVRPRVLCPRRGLSRVGCIDTYTPIPRAPARRQLSAPLHYLRGGAPGSSPTPSTGQVLNPKNSHIATFWSRATPRIEHRRAVVLLCTPQPIGSMLEPTYLPLV